ncbi:MAG: hypothetical protein IT462_08685 [Planctomycetes bacterium]|nr:hypothetical protein [Planctomycetota bacterium]
MTDKVPYITTDEIPYLKDCPKDGRVRPISTYHDGKHWHSYVLQPDKRVVAMKPIEVFNTSYVALSPASPSDVEIPLLTFLFQYFPSVEGASAHRMLYEDVENALAVLHKYFILSRHYDTAHDLAYSRVFATELEYALFNHRSAYDLLHKFSMAFIQPYVPKGKTIPDSFRRFAEKSDEERLEYGFSSAISSFYAAKKDRFMLLREMRDGIGHHGRSIDWIFKLAEGVGIAQDSFIGHALEKGRLWEMTKPLRNSIGSYLALIAFLAQDLLIAIEDFTAACASSFDVLPSSTAAGYRIFVRSNLNAHRAKLAEYIEKPWTFGTKPLSS